MTGHSPQAAVTRVTEVLDGLDLLWRDDYALTVVARVRTALAGPGWDDYETTLNDLRRQSRGLPVEPEGRGR